ncbi:aminotransferase class IV [Frigidibacter sp. MR17.24]|uniref:aminotransferase class IV n=1 Tax=Frigidibacter sp. MR17.24 TaxID=3127345 RepID=UPI00301319C7
MEKPFREAALAAGDRLIETLLWSGQAAPRAGRHLDRMAGSARALGFAFDRAAAEAALAAAVAGSGLGLGSGPGFGRAPLRLRLTLARDGALDAVAAPLPAGPAGWRVALAPTRIDAGDPLRGHKTTARALYDRDRAALPAGIDELVYANGADRMVEGTITTLVFDLGDGLSTPPLAEGCLPGVLRAALLAEGRLREAPLPLCDLPRAQLWCGNALRGLIPAHLVALPD